MADWKKCIRLHFVIHADGNPCGGVQSGLSVKTTYTPLPSNLLIAKVLSFGDIQECPADVFVPINSDYRAQGVSMFTNCPILFLDKLAFVGMSHTINFIGENRDCFGDNFHGVPDPALVIHSNLNDDRLPLNQYLELQRSSGDDMTVVFGRHQNHFVAVLHKVKVTLFGASFLATVSINKNVLEISGDTTVFQYPTHIHISSQINNKVWGELTFSVRGTFDNGAKTFVSKLNQELGRQLKSMAESGQARQQVASESLEKASEQLNITQTRYNDVLERIQQVNETYIAKQHELLVAQGNLSDAQEAFNNASEDLQESEEQLNQVCTEKTCDSVCMRGIRNKVCYRDTFIDRTETCLKVVPVEEKVATVRYELEKSWRFERICFSFVFWQCYSRGCCRGRRYKCDSLCVPFYSLKAIHECELVTVDKQVSESCVKQVYSSSVPYNCPEEVECAYSAPSSACIQANAFCRQAREAALQELEKAREGIREPFQKLQQAQNKVSMALTAIASAKNELESAEEREKELRTTLRILRVANSMAQVVYRTSLQQIGPFLNISKIISENTNIEEALNVVSVNLFSEFSPELEPPSELSLTLFCKSYEDTTITEKSSIYFDSLGIESIREIADEVIEETFLQPNDETGKRRKRQSADENSNRLIFEERCVHITNIRLFLLDLQAQLMALQESVGGVRRNDDQIMEENVNISEVINLNALQTEFNISLTDMELVEDEVVSSYRELISSYERSVNESQTSIDRTVLTEWQASMEQFYAESGFVGSFPCTSFADCLITSVESLRTLINLQPSANDTLLMELPTAQEGLLQLSLSTNLSIVEALEAIAPIVDIVTSYAATAYWCNTPPVITIQPPPEVNVSVDGTLQLSCQAESALPLVYGWKKDGNVLPEFQTNQLELSNMTRMDMGNFSCFAKNPVGITASISTSVFVYELPVFYLQPESVITYYGDDAGARFACNATSWPYPGWNWYHRAAIDDEWTIIEGEQTNELLIQKPNREHVGWYMCEAFNDYGSIQAEPASLLLVPFSVSQQVFPFDFTIVHNGSEDNECNTSDLGETIHTKISTIAKLDTIVTEVMINKTESQSFVVGLSLASQNVSAYYLDLYSFDEIANLALPSVNSTFQSVALLTEHFEEDNVVIHCVNTTYTVVPDSLAFDTHTYLCPDGQRLSPEYFLCRKLKLV